MTIKHNAVLTLLCACACGLVPNSHAMRNDAVPTLKPIAAKSKGPAPILIGYDSEKKLYYIDGPLAGLVGLEYPSVGSVRLVQFQMEGHVGPQKDRYQTPQWDVRETAHFKLFNDDRRKQDLSDWILGLMEEAYAKNSKQFNANTFQDKIPVIIYDARKDFEETNMYPGIMPEGLGGFTETDERHFGLSKRVTLPFSGTRRDFVHVLQHELTHSFQVEVLGKNQDNLPLWFTEGMAEHDSDSYSAIAEMYLRTVYMEDGMLAKTEYDNFSSVLHVYKQGAVIVNWIADNCKSESVPDPVSAILHGAKTKKFPEVLKDVCELTPRELDQKVLASLDTRYAGLRGKDDLRKHARKLRNGLLMATRGQLFVTMENDLGREDLNLNYIGKEKVATTRLAQSGRLGTESIGTEASISGDEVVYTVRKGGRDNLRTRTFSVKPAKDRSHKDKLKLGARHEYGWDSVQDIFNPIFIDSDTLAFIGKNGVGSHLYLFHRKEHRLETLTSDNREYMGLTYSAQRNMLVSSVETQDAKTGKYSQNLVSRDMKTGEIRLLTDTPENNTDPVFSPDGDKLLFISDKSGVPDLKVYSFADAKFYRVTDSQLGISHAYWSGDDTITFNTIDDLRFFVFQSPLPALHDPLSAKEEKKADKDAQEEKDADALFAVIPFSKEMTIIRKIVSKDKKRGVLVVNRNLSLDDKGKRDPAVDLYMVDPTAPAPVKISFSEYTRVVNFLDVELLAGSKLLLGYRHRDNNQEPYKSDWYLYDWKDKDAEKNKKKTVRFGKKSHDNKDWLGSSVSASPEGNYFLEENESWTTDTTTVYDVQKGSEITRTEMKKHGKKEKAETKTVEFPTKKLDGVYFASDKILTTVTEVDGVKEHDKKFIFQNLELPELTPGTTFTILQKDLLADTHRKVSEWMVSPDSRHIAILVEHKGHDMLRNNETDYEVWDVDMQEKKLTKRADGIAKIDTMEFDEKKDGQFVLKFRDGFNLKKTIVIEKNGEETRDSQELTAHQDPTVTNPDMPLIPREIGFEPKNPIRYKKGSVSRIPKPAHGWGFLGGMYSDHLGFGLYGAGTFVAYDNLNDRIMGAEMYMQDNMGIADFEYADLPSGQSLGFRYWHFNDDGKSVAVTYNKSVFLDSRFLKWDLYATEESANFNGFSRYAFLTERSVKTRLGSTFGIDTTMWDYHGPYSGNMFFVGAEGVANDKGYASAMDFTVEGRTYFPLTERSGTAFRAAAGKSVGREPDYYVMGGNKAMRGTSLFSMYGNNYVLGSAELRIPILDFAGAKLSGPMDMVLWPFMRYFDIRTGVYTDVGDAWYNNDQPLVDGGHHKMGLKYSAGWFVNVPTMFGLTARFSQGLSGLKDWNFWIGYNW